MRLIWGLILPVLLTLTFPSIAQERGGDDKHKDIEMLKVKFLTDRLDLTVEESQKFWPIYNNYTAEMEALWAQKRKNWYTNRDNPQQNLTTDLELDGRILATKKKYQKLFQSAISPKKILGLYRAEPEFREYLMRQIGHDRRFDDRNKK